MDAPSAPMFLSIFKVFQQFSGTYIQESRVQSTELKSYVKLNLNLIKSELKSCVGGEMNWLTAVAVSRRRICGLPL